MGIEDVFKLLERYSTPAMTKTVGLIVILYFAVLGVLRLLDTWRSFRTRRAILEEEKLFNEILKIRYEIEVLRKQYALPDFAPQPGGRAQDGIEAERVAGAPSVESAHTHYSFALPAVPTFSFAPIAALFSLPFNRPPAGWQRARWALKWILYLILLFVAFVAVVVSIAPESETGSFLLGLGGLIVVGFLLYFAVTALYNGVVAVLAARASAGTGGDTRRQAER